MLTEVQKQFQKAFIRQVDVDGRLVMQFATCGDRLALTQEEIDSWENFTADGETAAAYAIPVLSRVEAVGGPGDDPSEADYLRPYQKFEVDAKPPTEEQQTFTMVPIRITGDTIEYGKAMNGLAGRLDLIDGAKPVSVDELVRCGLANTPADDGA